MREVVCSNCQQKFVTKNNRAKYCPDCKQKWEQERQERKQKVCEICGKPFTLKSHGMPGRTICYDTHYLPCVVCGKIVEYNYGSGAKDRNRVNWKTVTCSKECEYKNRANQTHISCLEKYGVEAPTQIPEAVEKRKQTCLEKYGTEQFLSSETAKKKVKETNLEKYGHENCWGSSEIREKIKKTMIKRYGVKCSFQMEKVSSVSKKNSHSPEAIQKRKESLLQHFGVEVPMQSPEVREKYRQTMQERHGVDHSFQMDSVRRLCHEAHSNKNAISNINREFSEKLSLQGIENEFEYSELFPFYYDLYIPNLDTLIEIDPTVSHNSYKTPWMREGVRPEYHLRKTKKAVSHNLRCLHVFDWDDWDKIIKMLEEKETIFARNLEVLDVSSYEANRFEEQSHLQGNCRGQSVRLGLYKNKELIQIMTFGKPRYNKKYEWELLRLCTKPGYKVVGGAEKLFKHFIRQYQPTSIISYCDLSKFTGDVYKKLGMTEAYTTKPQKIWSKGSQKITDNYLRQHGADRLIGTSDGKGTDNEEIMLREGWLPVYDCGQLVFEWEAKKDA